MKHAMKSLCVSNRSFFDVFWFGVFLMTIFCWVDSAHALTKSSKSSPITDVNEWRADEFAKQLRAYDDWLSQEMSLSQLVELAWARSRLHWAHLEQAERASRHSAALPKVLIGYGADFNQKNAVVIEDTVSVTSGDILVGPEESKSNYNLDQGHQIDVRLQWDFSGLMYSRDQVMWARESRAISEARQTLSQKISDLYLKRAEYAEREFFSKNEHERQVYALRRQSLEAVLTAMTGYEFSRRNVEGEQVFDDGAMPHAVVGDDDTRVSSMGDLNGGKR